MSSSSGASSLFDSLDERRRQLGMTYAVLAKRSGVSMPTVVRILSGKQPAASFTNVLNIAESLGLSIDLSAKANPHDLLEAQARKKASELIQMLQATSSLEGQGVGPESAERMKQQTMHELLAGSKRNLWSD